LVTISAAPSRHLEERVFLRFPALVRWLARIVSALPPSSGLRRWFVGRGVRNTIEAVNRKDYAATFLLFHPEVVTDYARGLGALGLPTRTVTKLDRMNAQAQWGREWKEYRQDGIELVDFGERLLVLSSSSGTGMHSGASPTMEIAYLVDIDKGLIVRERMFLNHAEARRAAGLPTPH
jgi:hypothetical protein